MRRLLLATALAVALTGCGTDDAADTLADAPDQAQTAADLASKPKVEVPDGPAPTDLVISDVKPGSGAEAQTGKQVTVKYVGVTYADGKEFDSSWGREDFTFLLGAGKVIPGWDRGLVGMKEGGRRQLVIPPQLGYGSQGAGSDIPPDAALIFVVDLVKVDEGPAPAGPKPTVVVPKGPAPKELVVTDLKPGTGAEAVEGKQITVRYVGVTYADGKEFDSSWGGDDFTFVLGAGNVIAGWDKGFTGMKEGGRRQLVIPPDLAYGEQGSGPIAPNSTLVFVVDLVKVG